MILIKTRNESSFKLNYSTSSIFYYIDCDGKLRINQGESIFPHLLNLEIRTYSIIFDVFDRDAVTLSTTIKGLLNDTYWKE